MSTGIPIQEKVCIRCGETKPTCAFLPDKRAKTGLTSHCRACERAAQARRRAENPEKDRSRCTEWRAENTEKVRAYDRLRYAENPGKKKVQSAKWHADNPDRARSLAAKWRTENPEKIRALWSKRYAAKLNATPPWADFAAIAAVYAEQQFFLNLGVECHVDHIIPLQGKNVCGLHVHWNLRVLLAEDNLRKHNKVDESMALAFA